jgi:hypothetical protein
MRLREWFGTGWMPRKGRRSREVLAGTILFPPNHLAPPGAMDRSCILGATLHYASGSSSHKAGNIGKLKLR